MSYFDKQHLFYYFVQMNSNGLIFIGRLLSSPSNTPQVCQKLGSIGAWWFQTEPSKRKCHFQQKWCPILETFQLDRLIVITRSSRCCFCISLGHWVGKRGGGQVQGSKTKSLQHLPQKKHTFEKGVFESEKIDELNTIESLVKYGKENRQSLYPDCSHLNTRFFKVS